MNILLANHLPHGIQEEHPISTHFTKMDINPALCVSNKVIQISERFIFQDFRLRVEGILLQGITH